MPKTTTPMLSSPLRASARKPPAMKRSPFAARLGWVSFVGLFCLATGQAQTFTALASFNGVNGTSPNGVIQGADGNFYGTTMSGGANGQGTVFKLTADGTITVLYSFCSQVNCTDGQLPAAGLVQGADGNLYGTTEAGGAYSQPDGVDSPGTIFKITPSGVLTTLHSFSAAGTEGAAPMAALIQASDGNLYGTTAFGGTHMFAGGVLFRISPSGAFSTLYSFCALARCADGYYSLAPLVQASDGNLYGTTSQGGAGGLGSVFELTLGGAFAVLHSFSGPDGSYPAAGLVPVADGSLWGTTPAGGPNGGAGGDGVVFKITPAGVLSTIYAFGTTPADGSNPGALMRASNGDFYGTTFRTLFQITPGGALTTLLNTLNTANGGTGNAPLIQGVSGYLYGAAKLGGPSAQGLIFQITLALGSGSPSINAGSGIVSGASFQAGISPNSWITITGTNLSTVTDTWANAIVNGNLPQSLDGVSVNVSGVPAYIYYLSSTQINAVAPNVGTGPVQVTVTTPAGTSAPVTVTSQAEQPAFFQWGADAVATTQNYALAVKDGTFSGVATTPAKPGDVIILWGTGFGPTSPAAPVGAEVPSDTTYNTATPVSVKVGGADATVYGAALASGYAALYQVAIQIPASLSSGDYPVVATVDGVSSPSTTLITVQQ